MSVTIFIIALLGTLPILIVWGMGKKEWFLGAVILSALLAIGTGNPAFALTDLVFVGIVSYLAYGSLYNRA